MKSIVSLASIVLLAVACAAKPSLLRRNVCQVVSSYNIVVGDKTVEAATVYCPLVSRRGADVYRRQNDTTTDPIDVTNELCSTTCNNLAGDLPPESDDCATIVDAITILNGSISPTFDVDSESLQQLTYGTCRYFFENLSSGDVLEYSWLALSNTASAAGTTCFPPTEPTYSEGLCESGDGLWAVGAAHS